MKINKYEKLPVYAVDIRNEVFVKEQGFKEEFDDNDYRAIHLVGFIANKSVATCRIIKIEDDSFIIGRVAVRKPYRGLGLGSKMIFSAEAEISKLGGKNILIHSQKQAQKFYEQLGYSPIGLPDDEEGCPHQMLHKLL